MPVPVEAAKPIICWNELLKRVILPFWPLQILATFSLAILALYNYLDNTVFVHQVSQGQELIVCVTRACWWKKVMCGANWLIITSYRLSVDGYILGVGDMS